MILISHHDHLQHDYLYILSESLVLNILYISYFKSLIHIWFTLYYRLELYSDISITRRLTGLKGMFSII